MVCALTSAFVWLLSITASSSLILCIPDSLLWMRMVVAVCGQEAGRFCLAPIYDRYSSSAKGDWWNSAVASGVGFGTIHVLVVYGTMFDERQTTVAQAAIALIFANLDVVFTCLVFSKSRGSRPFVLIAHLLASAATTYAPQFSLPPVILLLFSSIFFLWRQRSRSNFSRRDTSDNTSERRKASGAPSHEEDDDEEVHTLTTAAQRETDETGSVL